MLGETRQSLGLPRRALVAWVLSATCVAPGLAQEDPGPRPGPADEGQPFAFRLPAPLAQALSTADELELLGLLDRAPDPGEDALDGRAVHARLAVTDPAALGAALVAACPPSSGLPKGFGWRRWTLRLRQGDAVYLLQLDPIGLLTWEAGPGVTAGQVEAGPGAREAIERRLAGRSLWPPRDWVEERPLEDWEARRARGAPGPTLGGLLPRLEWRGKSEEGALAAALRPLEPDPERRRRWAALVPADARFGLSHARLLAPALAGEPDAQVRATLLGIPPVDRAADRALVRGLLGQARAERRPPGQRGAAAHALGALHGRGVAEATTGLRTLAEDVAAPSMVRAAAAAALGESE